MSWGDAIFGLLTLAGLFVLVVIVFVLKSGNLIENEKISRKQDQPGDQE
jgi:hypothetical protein